MVRAALTTFFVFATLWAAPAEANLPTDAFSLRLAAAMDALRDPGAPDVLAIEDPSRNLEPFHESIQALGEGRSGRLKVRVALFGDSNHTTDWPAETLRKRLGDVLGHGGHGFVAAAQPWDWYQHTEIAVRLARRGWRSYAATEPRFHEDHYGHAGIAGLGSRGGYAEFKSKSRGIEANRAFSIIDVDYLCRPKGGALVVTVDKEAVETIDARCDADRFASRRIRVDHGEHTVRLTIVRGHVKVFGVSFENDDPGVVVDGLGVGALSVFRMQQMDEAVFVDSLRARAYDLVILHTGSNMWSPRGHRGWMDTVIARIQKALGPDVPILVLSPPDFVEKIARGRYQGHERMAQCGQEKRAAALEHGLAFWDFYAAMGGRGSVMDWKKKGVVQPDLIHFRRAFHDIMWTRLTRALMANFNARPAPTGPG